VGVGKAKNSNQQNDVGEQKKEIKRREVQPAKVGNKMTRGLVKPGQKKDLGQGKKKKTWIEGGGKEKKITTDL